MIRPLMLNFKLLLQLYHKETFLSFSDLNANLSLQIGRLYLCCLINKPQKQRNVVCLSILRPVKGLLVSLTFEFNCRMLLVDLPGEDTGGSRALIFFLGFAPCFMYSSLEGCSPTVI